MTEEELTTCHLDFQEQCKVVWEGLKKGFKYDGCTAVPDFDFGSDCCGEHDYYYQSKSLSRSEADRKLRECIRKKGYVVLPWVFWLGVRVFGKFWWWKRKKPAPAPEIPTVQSGDEPTILLP